MAHKRKDTLAAPKEWAKHLRRFGKRRQARAERRACHKSNLSAISLLTADV